MDQGLQPGIFVKNALGSYHFLPGGGPYVCWGTRNFCLIIRESISHAMVNLKVSNCMILLNKGTNVFRF